MARTPPLVDMHTLELLASRICHDLISPVSAMNNGLEFVSAEGPGVMKEAMELLSYSATIASAKLQVLRLIYGAGGADPNISLDEIRNTLNALVSIENRTKIEWGGALPSPSEQGSGYAKILAATIFLAIDSLPRGGTVSVIGEESLQVRITAEGTSAALRPGVEEALKGAFPAPALAPTTVHPYITALFCAQYGFTVSLVENLAGRVVFTLAKGSVL